MYAEAERLNKILLTNELKNLSDSGNKDWGPDPEILSNLANLASDQHHDREAKELYDQAIARAKERTDFVKGTADGLAPNGFQISLARAMAEKGSYFLKRGQTADAERLLAEAVKIEANAHANSWLDRISINDPEVHLTENKMLLARCYYFQGRLAESSEIYKHSLDVLDRSTYRYTWKRSQWFCEYAHVLRKMGRASEANAAEARAEKDSKNAL
jgi:tetratricopeptide (TPR) repeat protein